MGTVSASDILAERFSQIKQQKQSLLDTPPVLTPNTQPLIIKPSACTWEELQAKLTKVVNYPGLLKTVKELYDQGYGAELETAIDIALSTYKKNPINMFAAMVSKKAGNWTTKTLSIVHDTWGVRRNALEVVEKLKLGKDSILQVLSLSWRLRGSILRCLGMATEPGCNIKNPIGLFFYLTKKQSSTA